MNLQEMIKDTLSNYVAPIALDDATAACADAVSYAFADAVAPFMPVLKEAEAPTNTPAAEPEKRKPGRPKKTREELKAGQAEKKQAGQPAKPKPPVEEPEETDDNVGDDDDLPPVPGETEDDADLDKMFED